MIISNYESISKVVSFKKIGSIQFEDSLALVKLIVQKNIDFKKLLWIRGLDDKYLSPPSVLKTPQFLRLLMSLSKSKPIRKSYLQIVAFKHWRHWEAKLMRFELVEPSLWFYWLDFLVKTAYAYSYFLAYSSRSEFNFLNFLLLLLWSFLNLILIHNK